MASRAKQLDMELIEAEEKAMQQVGEPPLPGADAPTTEQPLLLRRLEFAAINRRVEAMLDTPWRRRIERAEAKARAAAGLPPLEPETSPVDITKVHPDYTVNGQRGQLPMPKTRARRKPRRSL